MSAVQFRDRREAGQRLADALAAYAKQPELLVLGLPRGGVPVAFEVAQALEAPLDVFLVRKLGTPGQPELAMGAIASGGLRVLNSAVVLANSISWQEIERATRLQERELERREHLYRGGRPRGTLAGKTVILVDDGIATGSTMQAAIGSAKLQAPQRVVVAVPTCAPSTAAQMRTGVDAFFSLITPAPFFAVNQSYGDFRQTTDEEVRDLLERAAHSYALLTRPLR